jgi:uncharacterized protein YecE (DUF72 family)
VRFYVGCAMWTHKAWPLPSHDRLRAYAGLCNAVEGNTTFYAVPSRTTVASWAQQTDPDFRMVIKLPRTVTHDHRLAGADEDMRALLRAIEPLGPRAHALWIQLPASFAPADLPVLARFMRRLPSAYRYAVEVRNPGFFTDPRPLEAVLATVSAEWIPFDTTVFFAEPPTSDVERATWTMKPRVPRRTRALTDRPIVRYLGRDANEKTIAGWTPWIDTVVGWLREGRSPTMFIHTPDDAEAPMLARRFHEAVRARLPEVEPLPEPTPTEPLTLF